MGDINVLTDKLEDLDKVSEVVGKFEKVSGAILSRNKKCKVIGFGNWAGREDWPLAWIKPVKSEKMFGLSRVYYVASVLPMMPKVVKKFESLMGKYLWNFSGKVLRVAIDEMKNKK